MKDSDYHNCLPQNTVRKQGIHVAFLSPAKTIQHRAHPLHLHEKCLVTTSTELELNLSHQSR